MPTFVLLLLLSPNKMQKIEKQSPKQFKLTTNVLLAGACVSLVLIHGLMLLFISNEAKTIELLQNESVQLSQDRKIISSAQDLTNAYKDEIDTISNVFPDEEHIPIFLQRLEDEIKSITGQYSIKINSQTPLVEN